MTTKTMNHAEYQKNMARKSWAELKFIIKDAGEALDANPEGYNAGYYQDEIHYAAAALRKLETRLTK